MAEPGRYHPFPMNTLNQTTAETRYVTRSSVELWQRFFFFTADRRRVGN